MDVKMVIEAQIDMIASSQFIGERWGILKITRSVTVTWQVTIIY